MIHEAKTHLLPGHAYGQSQSTLLIKIDLDPTTKEKIKALDDLLNELFDQPDCFNDFPNTGPQALLTRLMQAHLLVQREQKIPVFGIGKIVNFGTESKTGRARALLAVPCSDQQASNIALRWVILAINSLVPSQVDPNARSKVWHALELCQHQLRDYAVLGINAMHFLQAAWELGIATRRLSTQIFGFGLGSRMRWLSSSITDESSSIAVGLAHKKSLTANILRQYGIPTPNQEIVSNLEQAIKAAARIGFPVVVKPDDQEQGRGVSANLNDQQAVETAFHQASTFSKNILIEKHHEGQDYRLTVFRGQVVKVLHRSPGSVLGDGVHNIAQLVEIEHQTPRHRQIMRQSGRRILDLDTEALGLLAEHGRTTQTIPNLGERVVLRRKSNISAGGTQTLVPLEQIHPDNLDLAIRACEAIRLDLCGVDLLISDITKSWLESSAVIIELNAEPQIGIALDPEAYARILNKLGGNHWSIPLQLVICDSLDMIPSADNLTNLCGPAIGMSTSAGVWISGRQVINKLTNGFMAAQMLLLQRSTASALCCMTVEEVIQMGIPAPYFDRIVLMAGNTAQSFFETPRWAQVRLMVRDHTSNLSVLPLTLNALST